MSNFRRKFEIGIKIDSLISINFVLELTNPCTRKCKILQARSWLFLCILEYICWSLIWQCTFSYKILKREQPWGWGWENNISYTSLTPFLSFFLNYDYNYIIIPFVSLPLFFNFNLRLFFVAWHDRCQYYLFVLCALSWVPHTHTRTVFFAYLIS